VGDLTRKERGFEIACDGTTLFVTDPGWYQDPTQDHVRFWYSVSH
jgi:hypothetical protein